LQAIDIDDNVLVKKAQGGNVDAIGELYDRHHAQMFRYVWSRVGERPLAEDLTGELFTRMVSNLASYREQNVPFRAWLYRIARNLITDHYRKEGGKRTVPLTAAADVPVNGRGPAAVVEQKITMDAIEMALHQLDPVQREVVLLRFVVGLPLHEVAHAMDKSVAAVKSLQHRGLKALRVALQTV